jgi:hypothetical protein
MARPRKKAATAAETTGIMEGLNRILAENESLRRENDRLNGLLAQIEQRLHGTARRGRPAKSATATSAPAAAPKRVVRRRARITDPIALEKRRAALTKARAARAAKLAAAKKAS